MATTTAAPSIPGFEHNAYVLIPTGPPTFLQTHSTDYNFAGNFSLGGWIRTSTNPSGTEVLISKGTSDFGFNGYGYSLQYSASSGFIFTVIQTDLSPISLIVGPTGYQDQWVHLMAIGDTDTVRLYINGIERASAPWDGTAFVADAPLTIGAEFLGVNMLLIAFCDIKIYTKALEPKLVLELSQKGYPLEHTVYSGGLTDTSCIGAWKLAHPILDTIYDESELLDQSAAGNDLTKSGIGGPIGTSIFFGTGPSVGLPSNGQYLPMLANMGGLSSRFKYTSFGRGEAIMALDSEFNRTPLNEAVMTISSTWVPILDGSISTSAFEDAVMGISSQFNFIQISHGIVAAQDNDNLIDLTRPLQDTIVIGSIVKRVTDQEVTHSMGLTQGTPDNILTAFEVAQIVSVSSGTGIANAIELAQVITFNVNLARPVTHDLGIKSETSGFKVFADGRVKSIPESDPECKPLDRPNEFTVVEPNSSDSVTMKHPIIGDVFEVNSLTVDKSSRGNVDLSFVPPLHNQYIVRRLQFKDINRKLKNSYQNFLKAHAGLLMYITVPEGGIEYGHITNLETLFTDESSNLIETGCDIEETEQWDFEMIFVREVEGPPLEIVYNTNALGGTSSPSRNAVLPIGNNMNRVDWGDGHINNSNSHVYAIEGSYNIKVYGTVATWAYAGGGDCLKLSSVEEIGRLHINQIGSFKGCSNMVWNTTDAPVVITLLLETFNECALFNSNINNWDVSTSQFFSTVFQGCVLYNQPMDQWDTSEGLYFNFMFNRCEAFNQPVSTFNTSKALSMFGMFADCHVFNIPVPFNTSTVTDMGAMFSHALSFNQSLSTFDTSLVTNMTSMFGECDAFNQPVNHFDVANVENFFEMFSGANDFNQPVTSWRTSSATNMNRMFGATAFNQPVNHLETGNVTDMFEMFVGGPFDQDISSWDIGNVTSMTGMLNQNSMSTTNYSAWLVNLDSQPMQPNVTLGAQGRTYTGAAIAARANLVIAPKFMTILGDTPV